MKLGDRIELLQDEDRTPYATAIKGERGEVVFVDTATGEVEVRLDHYHPGLMQYQNCISFYPPIELTQVKVVHAFAKKLSTTCFKVAAALAMCAVVTFMAPDATRALRGPAATFTGHRFDHDTVHIGEALQVINTAQRHRVCMWRWSRSWSSAEPRVLVAADMVAGFVVAITDEPMTNAVSVPVPQGLKPGHYIFGSVGRAECDHGDVFTVQQPDLKFTLEE